MDDAILYVKFKTNSYSREPKAEVAQPGKAQAWNNFRQQACVRKDSGVQISPSAPSFSFGSALCYEFIRVLMFNGQH
jgi:hypothetical protein